MISDFACDIYIYKDIVVKLVERAKLNGSYSTITVYIYSATTWFACAGRQGDGG